MQDASGGFQLLVVGGLHIDAQEQGFHSIEVFGGFVYVNLDPTAAPLREQAGDLGAEIALWAPDVEQLTHVKRLHFEVSANWKTVIDNFLECYHCHIAHPEFVDLVDMDTYEVRTHGIWSSHFASAGTRANAAYDEAVEKARASD